MKHVMIITQATNVKSEPGYNRFKYLAEMLSAHYKVTFVTSDFNHYAKEHRDINDAKYYDSRFETKFLHETGYKKNITVKRIYSHIVFSQNLKRYLNKTRDIDLIILGLPPHDSSKFISKYAKKNDIKIIIDVNDLWPEALKNVIHNKFLYKLLTFPLQKKAIISYRMADAIVGVSHEYVNLAQKFNNKSAPGYPIYIGTFLSEFDKGKIECSSLINKSPEELWLVYIGTLGTSYDIKTAISAYKKLQMDGYSNVKFKILGRGPDERELKDFARNINADVDFLGYKDYKFMASFLAKSDIALNALKKRASQSIINKVGDYFSAGLPVLNGASSNEMNHLVEEYNCGLNYVPEDVNDLVQKMKVLIDDSDLRQKMGNNSRTLAIEKFNRESSYLEFIKIIEDTLKNNPPNFK